MENIFSVIGDYASPIFSIVFSQKKLLVYAMFLIFFVYDLSRYGWQKSLTKRLLSSVSASMAIIVANSIFIPIAYFGSAFLQEIYLGLNIPSLPVGMWQHIPFLILAIAAVFIQDFADYWTHRMMHKPFLWPIHAMHHSDREVTVLTTYRIHILEHMFMRLSYVVLFSLLGFPPEAIGLGGVFILLHNAYVHANVDWDHGPFKYLIASPQFHRWHHANDERAFGKNLANIVPAYDLLFGTYFNPYPCKSPMGANNVPHSDIVQLLAFPFVEYGKVIFKPVIKVRNWMASNSSKVLSHDRKTR